MRTNYHKEVLQVKTRCDSLFGHLISIPDMTKDKKGEVIKAFAKNSNDTGSAEVQIALLTARITDLTEHLKIHKNDRHSRRGLLKMIGDRRRLMNYLSKSDNASYKKVVKELSLREKKTA